MPYRSESIPLQGLQDRRRRLTDETKSKIRAEYTKGGWSLTALAREFGVSKKTVLLLVNPESAERARAYVRANWKNYQRSREERNETAREHRRYKQSLYLRGELKDTRYE